MFSALAAIAFVCLICVGSASAMDTPNNTRAPYQKIKHPTQAMSNEQNNVILNAMRQKRNDAEKIIVLKEGVKDKGITIDQLITLLNQFLTDDAKLECAEYAFPYTTNYKAFLKIMDLFGQEGYKWKLVDYYDKNKK